MFLPRRVGCSHVAPQGTRSLIETVRKSNRLACYVYKRGLAGVSSPSERRKETQNPLVSRGEQCLRRRKDGEEKGGTGR